MRSLLWAETPGMVQTPAAAAAVVVVAVAVVVVVVVEGAGDSHLVESRRTGAELVVPAGLKVRSSFNVLMNIFMVNKRDLQNKQKSFNVLETIVTITTTMMMMMNYNSITAAVVTLLFL